VTSRVEDSELPHHAIGMGKGKGKGKGKGSRSRSLSVVMAQPAQSSRSRRAARRSGDASNRFVGEVALVG
jgi:hypothetical protein